MAKCEYMDANAFTVQQALDVSITDISARWQCGLGHMEPGYTTYAPSSLERHWRTPKGICCQALPKVCRSPSWELGL